MAGGAIIAGIGAAMGIGGAVTRGVASGKQAKQQREEWKREEDILQTQIEESKEQTSFDVAQVRRQGARQLGTFVGRAAAMGVRGASSEAVSQDIQTQTETVARRREESGEAQVGVLQQKKGILKKRREWSKKNKGLLTASSIFDVGSAAAGGVFDVGTAANWW